MTAFAGSLLLAPLMLGLAQAGSAPDLKDAVIATHDGAVMLVREAEAVEAVAAEGMVEAAADSPAATAEAAVDSPAAVTSTPMPAAASIGGGRFDRDSRFDHDFRHRRVFDNDAFIGDGFYGYGYGDCYWLRRHFWARYEACLENYY